MKTPEPRKLSSGNYFIQLRLNGVSVPVTASTARECTYEAQLIKAEHKAGKRQIKAADSLTLSEAYKKYIEAKSGVLSPSTIAGYKRLACNTFQGLMKTPVSELTNEAIQIEISNMAKNKKSPKYIRNAEGLLSAVLKLYRPDFRMSVFMPQKLKQEPRRVTDEEITKIIAMVKGTDIELPILMALWMGMRMSEIRGAQYGDIKDHRLHIQRAIVLDDARKDAVKPPKTFSGDRWIDIPDYIETLVGTCEVEKAHLVPLTAQTIYKRFVKLQETNGIPHCKFHDLRHANAAVMVRLGIESKYAQERNGWSSDRMYKQVYAYTMDDEMSKASKAINTYFANKIAN